MPLTAKDVAEIARLLEESEFEELHVEQEGLRLTLKRGAATARAGGGAADLAAAAPAEGPARSGRGPQGAKPRSGRDRSLLEVTAPFVGIFHRAPKPGSPPYVDVGAVVQEDTIIGIIEVMKLMNTVRAETRGTVEQILVADGTVVEYGQVLLRIAPGVRGG